MGEPAERGNLDRRVARALARRTVDAVVNDELDPRSCMSSVDKERTHWEWAQEVVALEAELNASRAHVQALEELLRSPK